MSTDDEQNLAHNIVIKVKKDDEFKGKIDKDNNEFTARYKEASFDYNLNLTPKFRYLHNFLKGKVEQFFHTNIYSVSGSF